MSSETDGVLVVSPTCPKCDLGDTFTRSDDTDYQFENEDANAYCTNCEVELYVPPEWFSKDAWRDDAEVF